MIMMKLLITKKGYNIISFESSLFYVSGGAFIKVESGEMYRVKSVQSEDVENNVSGALHGD